MIAWHDVSPEVIGGFLVTFGLASLALLPNRSGHLAIAAVLAVAAWLFVGLDILIWLWGR